MKPKIILTEKSQSATVDRRWKAILRHLPKVDEQEQSTEILQGISNQTRSPESLNTAHDMLHRPFHQRSSPSFGSRLCLCQSLQNS